MEFINKKYDVSLSGDDLVFHCFHAFLELSAHFCTGYEFGHFQYFNPFAHQGIGHFGVNDSLRQTFHDNGFPHSRFAYDYGIVFSPARKNLDDAVNFFFSAYDRVEFPFASQVRQVGGELFQNVGFTFGIFFIDSPATSHGINLTFDLVVGDSHFLKQVKHATQAFVEEG